eukprot:scaffold3396_cov95-Skeletonema_dohrnii-CCMP3373.AAC.4
MTRPMAKRSLARVNSLTSCRAANNKIAMSADETEAVGMQCCGSCGITEIDEIKLMECADCDLVRYCSDKCQQDLGLMSERAKSGRLNYVMRCCSKLICNGCVHATFSQKIQMCPFCRCPISEVGCKKNEMRRIAANDPFALREMGKKYDIKEDYEGAFEYWTKAAEFGDVEAHDLLSSLYRKGQYVEKDEEKERYHLEEAAIGGHPVARYFLAINEIVNKKYERAVKHLIIAAKLGHDESIKSLMQVYKIGGHISKEEFAATLRAHQAAVDATKSSQREEAAAKQNS